MDDPESTELTTGEQLRKFFLELLEGTNLRDYRANRAGYIGRRNVGEGGYLGKEATALLNSTDLQAIEKHIDSVTGSSGAIIICVVFPPI